MVSWEIGGRVKHYSGELELALNLKKMKIKSSIFYANSYGLQILITKTSGLSDKENSVFILIHKTFSKI